LWYEEDGRKVTAMGRFFTAYICIVCQPMQRIWLAEKFLAFDPKAFISVPAVGRLVSGVFPEIFFRDLRSYPQNLVRVMPAKGGPRSRISAWSR